jgi:peptidoglycan/xylan/chitin deacetylase (PgdA/CDA1 family)
LRVALTFDAEHPDRPTALGVQERLLDALERADVRATVFVQGRWAEAYPDTARRIRPAGHLVGSHSFYHTRMPLFSGPGFEEDVRSAERALIDILGIDPRPWFRFPFGAGFDDPQTLARLEALGYRHSHWDVEPDDWDPRRTARQVEDTVVDGVLSHGDGAVVLLHTWPSNTIDALPGILNRLRDNGASFVPLDELPGSVAKP